MQDTLKQSITILEKLVSFQTVSSTPTHQIVDFIESYLSQQGVKSFLSYDADGARANVFATIGPQIDGGVVLNGHTDVVPVEGQQWATDPFKLTRINDRLYGRGSVDMKGFLACVLASVPVFQSIELKKPIHIAFSYDEEIGGLGMPVLLNSLDKLGLRPGMAIVGEPTNMQLVTGHKGGYEMRCEIKGCDAHACNPSLGVNAISVACQLITKIELIAARMASQPQPLSPFEPAFCTFNIGTIEGGTARNATAGWCHFNWEFRPMPGDDGEAIIDEIQAYANNELLPAMQAIHPACEINIITEVCVPALNDNNAALASELVSSITGLNSTHAVSFGTDAGYFSDVGISTVVFGPGDINRAHKADEYIEVEELSVGLAFLAKLAKNLAS